MKHEEKDKLIILKENKPINSKIIIESPNLIIQAIL